MDIEKLIHCLQCCAMVDAHNGGCDDCGLEYCGPECQQLCGTAATALSTLQAENEKLRAEAEGMRSNWYKAVEEVKKLRAELDEKEKYYDQMIDALSATDSTELEQVKQERDEAVECINTVYSYILIKSKTDAVRTIEKWLRGQKEG